MKPLNFLPLLLAMCSVGTAQLSVEVVLDQEQYLPGEAIVARVRVANFSGQTLGFGDSDDWLVFNVESRDGYVIEKIAEVPVAGKFELESSSTATKRVDLAPYFTVNKPGRYVVSAVVKVRQWDREWGSKNAGFNVIRGVKLWEQDAGIPKAGGGEPELRKYALLQANYLKQLTLYVRVSDADEVRLFKVAPIGPLVSFSKPEGQVDKVSNLHVLWQVGARSFQYLVLNPEGETIVRQTHEYGQTRPALRADDSGGVVVAGGVRRETPRDLPAKLDAVEPAPKAPVAPQ